MLLSLGATVEVGQWEADHLNTDHSLGANNEPVSPRRRVGDAPRRGVSHRRSLAPAALDESMRSMRETKLYQHYTIVTLGAVHASCNEFKSCKDTRKCLSCVANHFGPKISLPQPRRRLLHDNHVVRPASGRNTRGVVDHLFELT